jgi:hypothetical protein
VLRSGREVWVMDLLDDHSRVALAAREGVRSSVYEAQHLRQAELALGGSVFDGRDPPGAAR